MSRFSAGLTNNFMSSLVHVSTNESLFSTYDYQYDNNDNSNNNNSSGNSLSLFGTSGSGPQHLASILHKLFSKMSDNESFSRTGSSSSLFGSSATYPDALSPWDAFIPSASLPNTAHSYRFLSLISLWFVLIVNPIVILFGVTGNLLATYILIHCNIAKLPVSFYTIMLNISDTLNLLIPVLIFWLDNCFNRTPDRGYFRDQSNFLCKALMCPDQLFAALSAWYMCAISFNRWYSVCRPSSYFFRMAMPNNGGMNGNKAGHSTSVDGNRGAKKHSSSSTPPASFTSLYFPFNCYCLTKNMKIRHHLQAFRSIACITLLGILCCLYPIFMHELRSIVVTNEHVFDLKRKTTRTYAVIWKRCYYSEKHGYAYDIIGIVLSCLLHILPLTFVAAMNIMIIVRLKQRQRLMTASANLLQATHVSIKRKKPCPSAMKRVSYPCTSTLRKIDSPFREDHSQQSRTSLQPASTITHKDQATSTDLPMLIPRSLNVKLPIPIKSTTAKRHHSRDRTITIMLVSVALSYLILTLPYRLFWSYNVYIKRLHPERMSSPIYLLKMHYIDHVLRTIRNIHYGTNFMFFIFLSKTFRRRFRQLFIEKFFQTTDRLFRRTSISCDSNSSKSHQQHLSNPRISRRTAKPMKKVLRDDRVVAIGYLSRSIFDEIPSLVADAHLREEGEILPIIELEHNNLSRYDGE